MNKAGFIKILKHGRKSLHGRHRFSGGWVDRSTATLNKNERVSCCYALFYKGARDDENEMIRHCQTDEHILKLVTRHGFMSEYLRKEVRYYTSKILEGS